MNTLYGCYTKKLEPEDIDSLPNRFFPSFFQRFIPKEYELKIVYFDGKLYPGLLISADENNVDIRKDLEATPLPIKLDTALKTKLLKLVKKLKLPICTIDIIYGIDGKHYFLEVNPSGQFGYVSYGCNYNLEKIIAKKLVSHYQT
jgi:glutathione synthase/RimK-type ligase-like ATP-grasp enzyme